MRNLFHMLLNCYSFNMHLLHWTVLHCDWDIPVRHHVVPGTDLQCCGLRILLNRFHTKFRKYGEVLMENHQ